MHTVVRQVGVAAGQDERARFSGGRVSKHDARAAASAKGICVVCAM
jgi:hypothetical protein